MREPVEHVHTNARGERVRILGWAAPEPRATLCIHHGLGEHIGRYQDFADALPEVSVWGYDARGHGPYTDRPGHACGLPELATDLAAMLPVLADLAGADRLALMGHSMGAAVVLEYLVSHPPDARVDRLILSAAPLVVHLDAAQRIKVVVGRILARIAPSMTLASGLRPEQISTDLEEVARYASDPLVHDRVSLELARSLVDDAPKLLDRVGSIALPALVVHGGRDPIADPEGGRQLAARLPHATLRVFDGAFHEVHHEVAPIREAFFHAVREALGLPAPDGSPVRSPHG